MEDMILQLAFLVAFLCEKKYLSLSTSLLVYILLSWVNKPKPVRIELKSRGIECEIQLSDELLIWLTKTSAVVSHHRLLQLKAAFAHYLLYLADSYFV